MSICEEVLNIDEIEVGYDYESETDRLNISIIESDTDGTLTEDELLAIVQEATLEVKINEDVLAIEMTEFLSLGHPTRRELGVTEYAIEDIDGNATLHDDIDKQFLLDEDETAIIWPDF